MDDPEPWVLVVCGDINEHFSVYIEDSHNCTVKNLKENIEAKTNISYWDQILYYGETELSELTKNIREYDGLKNGMPLYLVQSNFVIRVTRSNDDRTEEISIPRSELKAWTVKKVRESVCHKFKFEIKCDHYLICGAKVIERKDDEKSIVEYPAMEEGCIFTPLKNLYKADGKPYHTPPNITEQFLRDTVHIGHLPFLYTMATWKLKICGDVEVKVDIEDAENCNIDQLKQKVKEKTQIPVVYQTLYCEKEKLEHDDNKSLYQYSGLKNGAHVTLRDLRKKAWMLNICGDINSTVDIEDAQICTIMQLKQEVEVETGIPVSSQTLYYKEEKLEHNDEMSLYVYPGLKNCACITLRDCRNITWQLEIRGDVQGDSKVDIEDAQSCTVNQLKQKVKEKTRIPVNHQTLYCENKKLDHDEEKSLHVYPQLKNGKHITLRDLREKAWKLDIHGDVEVPVDIEDAQTCSIKQLKQKVKDKTEIPVSNQVLYNKEEKLEHNDQMSLYVYPGLKNCARITLRHCRNITWQLEICGDVQEDSKVDIEDAQNCTVNQLKQKVEEKTEIPVNQQTLYCKNKKLEHDEEKSLYVYPELNNGARIILQNLQQNTWVLNICGDVDRTAEVHIQNAQTFTINQLKEKVKEKTQIPVNKHILYCDSKKLEHDEQKSLYDYPGLLNGAHITLRDLRKKAWKLNICGDVEISVDIEDAHSCTVNQLIAKVQQKTAIHASKFTLYCGMTKLKHDDTNHLYVYPDLKNNVSLTLEKAWVLVICGDIRDPDHPIAISIEDPKTCTVNDLKVKIQEKENIPVSEQTLFCGKKELEQEYDKHLDQYGDKGLKNGVAVCVKRSNIVITAQRTDNNGEVTAASTDIDAPTVTVSIPRSQLGSWTVRRVRECICHKFWFPAEGKHYLISGGTVLEDDNKEITEYLAKNDDGSYKDSTLIFTPLKKVSMAAPGKSNGKPMYVTAALSLNDAKTKLYTDQPLLTDTKNNQSDAWKGIWTLNIHVSNKQSTDQQLTIFEVQVPECGLTPVFKLREIIQNKCIIAVNKQKLSIGDKILNDWDDEGKPKLLCNYPIIHDGATINLTKVPHGQKGKIMKVKQPANSRLIPSKSDLIFPVPLNEIVDPPSSIIVYSDEKNLEKLVKVVSNCEGTSSDTLYIQKTRIFGSGISEVKSMDDIKDGCWVTTTKQT